MAASNNNSVLAGVLLVLLMLIIGVVYLGNRPGGGGGMTGPVVDAPVDPSDPAGPADPGTTDTQDPQNPNAPEGEEEKEPAVIAAFLTRRGAVPFQSLVRYDKVAVKLQDMPGWEVIAAALTQQGQGGLPPYVYRVDQVTESVINNFGQETRSLVSMRSFLNPLDGRTIAYDIAITSGGIPQRLVGHLNSKGVEVRIFRGEQIVDRTEVAFPARMSILPVEIEFLHHWYVEHPGENEPVRWTFFVPEVTGFVMMEVKPLGKETIAHRGETALCAKYDVKVTSTKAQSSVFALQRMWFDLDSSALLRRMDFEEGVDEAQAMVSERVPQESLETLQPLIVHPPKLKGDSPLPYELGADLSYTVMARGNRLGRIHVRFGKQAADEQGPEGYEAQARLRLDTGGSVRNERARTRFTSEMLPVQYEATGTESVETEADYQVAASFKDNRVELGLFRNIQPPKPGESTQHPMVMGDDPAHDEPDTRGWSDPLRRVASSVEDQAEEQRPQRQDEQISRVLDDGVFVFDFHRVEHLAAIAHRFPRPPVPEKGAEPQTAYQKVAFYSVRRNQAGVVYFTVTPEPRMEADDDEDLQDPDLKRRAVDLPQLYVAHSTSALLPCTLLLGPDGRLLQMVSRYGSSEVIYTLDDPIMHLREQQEIERRGQPGPTLLRPPWF